MPSTLDLFEAFHLHELRESREAGIEQRLVEAERTETMNTTDIGPMQVCAGCGGSGRDTVGKVCLNCKGRGMVPDNVYAAHDAQHPPPDWMVDQEAVRQARVEMEEARRVMAEKWRKANENVQRCLGLVRRDLGPIMDEGRLVHNVRELVIAMDELQAMEQAGGAK